MNWIPRALGVVVLGLAVFAFSTDQLAGMVVLAIMGLVLLLIPKRVSDRAFGEFLSVGKRLRALVLTIVIDGAYWLLFLVFAKGVGALMQSALVRAEAGTDLSLASAEIIQQNIAVVREVMWIAVGLMLVFLVGWFFIYVGSRYLVWSVIMKKDVPFWRFSLLNLVWWVVAAIPLLFIVFGLKAEAVRFATVLLVLVYLYFTLFVHFAFFRKPRVGESLGKAIVAACASVRHLGMFFVYVLVVFMAVFPLARFLPPAWGAWASFVLVIPFVAWLRLFMVHVFVSRKVMK